LRWLIDDDVDILSQSWSNSLVDHHQSEYWVSCLHPGHGCFEIKDLVEDSNELENVFVHCNFDCCLTSGNLLNSCMVESQIDENTVFDTI